MYKKIGKENHNFRHGMATSKGVREPLYLKWSGMKRRCFNKNEKCYPNYGGRGITVSEEWLDFKNFANDMGKSFKKGLSLDRIDVNGNYCKENCRWIDFKEQQKNRRSEHTKLVLNRIWNELKSKALYQAADIVEEEIKKL